MYLCGADISGDCIVFGNSTEKWIGTVTLLAVTSFTAATLQAQRLGQTVKSPSNLGSFSTPLTRTLHSVNVYGTGPTISSLSQPTGGTLTNPLSARISNGSGAVISNPLRADMYQRQGAARPQLGGGFGRSTGAAYPGLGGGHSSFSPISRQLAAPTQLPTSSYNPPTYRQPSLSLGIPGVGAGSSPTYIMPTSGNSVRNRFGMFAPARKPAAERAPEIESAVTEVKQKPPRTPVSQALLLPTKPIGNSLSSASGPNAGRYLKKGEQLFAEGQYVQASKAFRTAVNMERKNPVTHLVRVHALVATAQYRQAQLALVKTQSLDPRLSLVKHVKLREFYGNTSDLDMHMASLKRYYVTNSASPDTIKLYGYMLLISERISDARKILSAGVKSYPEDAMLSSLLSIVQ